MIAKHLIAVAWLFIMPSFSMAKVSSINLQQLVHTSDYIVLAITNDVFEINGIRIARASLIRNLGNKNVPRDFYFLAHGTWGCDISTSETNEQAILFLSDNIDMWGDSSIDDPLETELNEEFNTLLSPSTLDAPLYYISFAGRGRMPIKGIDVILYSWDLNLPDSLSFTEEDSFHNRVPLSALVDFIDDVLQKPMLVK